MVASTKKQAKLLRSLLYRLHTCVFLGLDYHSPQNTRTLNGAHTRNHYTVYRAQPINCSEMNSTSNHCLLLVITDSIHT